MITCVLVYAHLYSQSDCFDIQSNLIYSELIGYIRGNLIIILLEMLLMKYTLLRMFKLCRYHLNDPLS